MTGDELLAELKKPGNVILWIGPLDSYLPVTKAYLREILEGLTDRSDLTDIRAYRDDDALLTIEDFGPEGGIE